MKLIKLTLLLALFMGSFVQVKAQYTGEGSLNSAEIKTVKYVKDNASKLDRSEEAVKLKGHIIKQINHKHYWFRDATGKIKLEIDTDILPKTTFDENTELLITGEVDYDWLEGTEIEVDKLEFTAKIKKIESL